MSKVGKKKRPNKKKISAQPHLSAKEEALIKELLADSESTTPERINKEIKDPRQESGSCNEYVSPQMKEHVECNNNQECRRQGDCTERFHPVDEDKTKKHTTRNIPDIVCDIELPGCKGVLTLIEYLEGVREDESNEETIEDSATRDV